MFAAFLLLAACDGALPARGFVVTLSYPDDGGQGAPTTPVRVGFSQPPDVNACERAIRLAALGDDARVAWEEPFVFVEDDSADAKPNTWLLEHDEPLVLDLSYAIVVPNGDEGCVSESGDDVEPFVSQFSVRERPTP